MHRFRFVICALAVLLMGAGLLVGADKKTKGRHKKGLGSLPPGFSKLELTDEQVQKIREVHSKNRGKLADLRKQLAEVLKTEHDDIHAVLTDVQKAKLKEMQLVAREMARAKAKAKAKGRGKKKNKASPTPDKTPDDKKPVDKKSDDKKPDDKKPEKKE